MLSMMSKSKLLLHIPHSSKVIPAELRKEFIISDEKLSIELFKMTDAYTDELFPDKYPRIVFPVSRLVCDPERFRDDEIEPMALKGMGAVYTNGYDRGTIRTVTNRENILQRFYDVYHEKFEKEVQKILDNNELCLIVDCHSFSDVPLPYEDNQDITFVYNSYGVDFKLKPKRKEKYIVSPYQMVTANGYYYLIGNYDKYDDVSYYWLDKITFVEVLDENSKPMKCVRGLENGLNLPKHLAEHIYMYSGESISVKMDVPQDMMNELIDWFGKDFRIISKAGSRMQIGFSCNRQAVFYWALQYGLFIEILEPVDLREDIKKAIRKMGDKYR